MSDHADLETARPDALFAAPAKTLAVPFVGTQGEPSSERATPAAAAVARLSATHGNATTFRMVSRLRGHAVDDDAGGGGVALDEAAGTSSTRAPPAPQIQTSAIVSSPGDA